ncbi:MAG: hypothetical protein AB7L91_19050, partial [Dehalococcoidia bacterium]
TWRGVRADVVIHEHGLTPTVNSAGVKFSQATECPGRNLSAWRAAGGIRVGEVSALARLPWVRPSLEAKVRPESVRAWMLRHGISTADLGVPGRAILRSRVFDLAERPASWTNPNAYAVAVHQDFLRGLGNAQHLVADVPGVRDFDIVIIRSMMGGASEVETLRHELWHLNNRGPDTSGGLFHEPWAYYFGRTGAAWAWAVFPPSRNQAAVR